MPPFTGWYLGDDEHRPADRPAVPRRPPRHADDRDPRQRPAGVRPLHADAGGRLRRRSTSRSSSIERRQGRRTSAPSSTRRCSRRSACPRGCRPTTSPATRSRPARRSRPATTSVPGSPRDLARPRPSRAPSSCSSGRWPTRGCCSPTSAPTTSTRPRRAPGGTSRRLLAHMEDALDAFTEAAAGRVEVDPVPPTDDPGRRAAGEGVRPARRVDGRPARRRVAVGDLELDGTAAGRDRRPRDHRARLGRRPGDRPGHADPRRPGPRAAGRSPSTSSSPPTAGTRFAAARRPVRRVSRPFGRALLAFLGHMTGPVGWQSRRTTLAEGHCFLTLPHGAHRPSDGRVRPGSGR